MKGCYVDFKYHYKFSRKLMKKLLILCAFCVSMSANAYEIVCQSSENYSDGTSVTSEFSMPLFNDTSVRSYQNQSYDISIFHESQSEDIGRFDLIIKKDETVLMNQKIEMNVTNVFENADLTFFLDCRIDVR